MQSAPLLQWSLTTVRLFPLFLWRRQQSRQVDLGGFDSGECPPSHETLSPSLGYLGISARSLLVGKGALTTTGAGHHLPAGLPSEEGPSCPPCPAPPFPLSRSSLFAAELQLQCLCILFLAEDWRPLHMTLLLSSAGGVGHPPRPCYTPAPACLTLLGVLISITPLMPNVFLLSLRLLVWAHSGREEIGTR